MKTKFSKKWNASKKPSKQRKYVYNSPLHIVRRIMSSHLSKELRIKYKKRSFPIRKGDTIKVMTGQFKGKIGKITIVDRRNKKVQVENVNLIKRDGTKLPYSINPSNLIITELDLDDKLRKQALERK